MIIPNLV